MPGFRPTQICTLVLLLLLPASCVSKRIPADLSIDSGSDMNRSAALGAGQRAEVAWDRNFKRITTARELERKAITTEDPRTAAHHTKSAEGLIRKVLNDHEAPPRLIDIAQQMLDRSSASSISASSGAVNSRPKWRALPPKLSKLDAVGGPWEKITVHHSDEVGALVFNGTFQQSCEAMQSIQRQHLVGNGWGDIGYHFLIDGRGRVFEGRSLEWQGAHAGNSAKNRRNLGVCLLGNFDKHPPSAQASESLGNLLEDLRRRHGIPRRKIYLHSEFTNTDCPGEQLTRWVRTYRSS